jgi:hypothetical protein
MIILRASYSWVGSFSKPTLSSKYLSFKIMHLFLLSFSCLGFSFFSFVFIFGSSLCYATLSWVFWSSPSLLGFVELTSITVDMLS